MENKMFEPVLDAGLTQGEFAHVAGVCRATALFWMNGKKKPHHIHADKIANLLDKIKSLVDAKQLPVSPRLRGAKRKAEIFRLILDDVNK